jgi:hypothetical protein
LSTLSGSLEQPSSMTPTAVDAVPVALLVAVTPDATDALRAARLEDALLARCDSMPVAAARPITAAERMAMIHERMKTRRLQPNIVLPVRDGGSGWATAGCAFELKGDATVWPPYDDGGAGAAGCSSLGAGAVGGS